MKQRRDIALKPNPLVSTCRYLCTYASIYVYSIRVSMLVFWVWILIAFTCESRVSRLHSTWNTFTHTYECMCERDMHAHTHTQARGCSLMNTRTHARARAHTHALVYSLKMLQKERESLGQFPLKLLHPRNEENCGVRNLWHIRTYTPVSSTPASSSSPPSPSC